MTNSNNPGLKLAAAFAALILILISVGWLGLSHMAALEREDQRVVDKQVRDEHIAREALEYSTINSRIALQLFILTNRDEIQPLLARREANSKHISALLDEISTRLDDDNERAMFAQLLNARTNFFNAFFPVLDLLVNQNKPEEARAALAQVADPLYLDYLKLLESFVDLQARQVAQASGQAQRDYSAASNLVVVQIALAVVVAAAIGWVATRSLTNEITTRKRAEAELLAAREHLEERVSRRTAELTVTNEKLRESEGRYRQLIESSPDAILIVVGGEVAFASPTAISMFGASTNSELVGRSIANFLQQDCLDNLREKSRNSPAFGADLAGKVCKLLKLDGTLFYGEQTSSECDWQGRPAIQLVIRDVTSRVAAEAALCESQRRQQAILDAVPDLVWLKDSKGRYLAVNRAWSEFHGVDEARAIGRTGSQIFPEAVAAKFEALYQSAVSAGRPLRFETEVPRAGLAPAAFETSLVPLFDGNGDYSGMAGIARDVSARKAALETLRLQSGALEAAANGIVITDRTGNILWCNPAFSALTGYSSSEVLCKNPRILKSGRQDRAFYERLWKTILAGDVWQGELVNRRKDGAFYHEEMTITPVRNSSGEITHFIAIKQDISQRKLAETRLAGLNRQLQDASRQAGMAEVASSVLHNVGNVLNSINISTSVASDTLRNLNAENLARAAGLLKSHADDLPGFFATNPRAPHLVPFLDSLASHFSTQKAAVMAELTSLAGYVEHVKEIVAMQQNYAQAGGVLQLMPPADLVEDALRINAGALERHGVTVSREFSETPAITVDKHKVLQILINLIRNSKYALADSGRADKILTLRIATTGSGGIAISVCDNGVGIPSENLGRIFELGFTTRKDGHGFGLHNSALAAREMGGTLTVQTGGPGKGAVFTLEIPVHPVPSARPVACVPESAARAADFAL
jgi:PAS domain S-box-containing protein